MTNTLVTKRAAAPPQPQARCAAEAAALRRVLHPSSLHHEHITSQSSSVPRNFLSPNVAASHSGSSSLSVSHDGVHKQRRRRRVAVAVAAAVAASSGVIAAASEGIVASSTARPA